MEPASAESQSSRNDDARAALRQRRLNAIVDELVPRIRRACPTLPDEIFFELIEEMAMTKLRDEEFNR